MLNRIKIFSVLALTGANFHKLRFNSISLNHLPLFNKENTISINACLF